MKANTRNINNVKIAHLNVRSLKCRDHFLLVKDTILSNKFDVFTISESWLDVSVSDLEIEVPGYNIYRVDRSNKTGGGICAYVLNTYCTELMGDISDISTTGFHQLWLKIQVRNLKSIIICTGYRPPDTPLTCWENDLTTTLIYALSLDKPVYIMGDLNCNLLSTECRELKSLTSFYESFNLSQLIAAPTRVTESSWSLLDVILASQTKQVVKAGVMDSSISDHDMVFSILHLKVSQPKTTHITTRSLKNYNPGTFQFDMSGAPWSVVKVFDDVDDKLHAFDLLFNEILDHHAPIRSIKVRGKPNPCITEEIRELMKSRNVWRKTARRTNDPHAWSTYKNLKHQVRKSIRAAESEFIKDQIQNNPRNTNCIWKAIRLCIPKRSVSPKVYSKEDKIVADTFNIFFASVGKSTNSKIESLAEENNFNLNNSIFTPRSFPTSEQFTFHSVECKQVEEIINAMPSNKAPGIDKVPTRVIKDCLPIILPFVTSIINASLSSSTFPGICKTAEITPIPKQGNHELPDNNRPISLLPVLSKVCERVAYNQFVTYLTTNKRLTTKQNGSKKWHSTETSLLRTTDAFLKGIDNKKLTACVLLDMSKVFDSVDHQKLLRKLQDVGASTNVL